MWKHLYVKILGSTSNVTAASTRVLFLSQSAINQRFVSTNARYLGAPASQSAPTMKKRSRNLKASSKRTRSPKTRTSSKPRTSQKARTSSTALISMARQVAARERKKLRSEQRKLKDKNERKLRAQKKEIKRELKHQRKEKLAELRKDVQERKRDRRKLARGKQLERNQKAKEKIRDRIKSFKDPEAPKRHLSAFMFYCKKNRQSKDNSQLTPQQIVATLGSEWKALNESDKKPFQELAQKDKERVSKEREEYKKKDTTPKRPLTPFMMFVKEKRQGVIDANPELKKDVSKVVSELGRQWSSLAKEEKESYSSKSAKLAQEYESILKSWGTKYIKTHAPEEFRKSILEKFEGGRLKNPTHLKVVCQVANERHSRIAASKRTKGSKQSLEIVA